MIGDDVLKPVATRVTIDGTAPEGSPVEASLTSISIHRHDQESTARKQTNWNLRVMYRTQIKKQGIHREAQRDCVFAFPVRRPSRKVLTDASHLLFRLCDFVVSYMSAHRRAYGSRDIACGCVPQSLGWRRHRLGIVSWFCVLTG